MKQRIDHLVPSIALFEQLDDHTKHLQTMIGAHQNVEPKLANIEGYSAEDYLQGDDCIATQYHPAILGDGRCVELSPL